MTCRNLVRTDLEASSLPVSFMELGGARQAAGGEKPSRILPNCEACEPQEGSAGQEQHGCDKGNHCLLIGWSMCHRIEHVPGTIKLVKSLRSGRSWALVGNPLPLFLLNGRVIKLPPKYV